MSKEVKLNKDGVEAGKILSVDEYNKTMAEKKAKVRNAAKK